MSNKKTYNFDFRPKSYWDIDTANKAILINIRGEERKKIIRDLLEKGGVGEIKTWMLSEKLTDEERKAIGRLHPLFMGGEYLPDYLPGEIEIARVSYASSTGDVISIRACPKGSAIHYRIVDDFDLDPKLKYTFNPKKTKEPFSMIELINFLDSVKHNGNDEYPGIIDDNRNCHLAEGCEPKELVDFVIVSSDFYPDIEAYYRDQAREWLRKVNG